MTPPMQAELAENPTQFTQGLFTGLPGRYDVLAEVLSFNQNSRWRRAMVDQIVAAQPTRVLDVATGTAGVALQIAARTGAEVTGIDLTEAMLRQGQARVQGAPEADDVILLAGRAEVLPFPDATFDALTFTYLLRYVADPAATVRELARVLKPGAPMASLDFAVPRNPIWRGAWWCYTRFFLPIGGVLGGRDWVRVGRFLGPNISEHYARHPVPSIVEAWRAAGMTGVGTRVMSLGGGLVMWGTKARAGDDDA
jgi:demethylmenaquinone methyltransferase / 2-methoxy-6-polyprenyl-1,4-benzoquinol methylase